MKLKPGTVRIIAGQWRGKRIPLPAVEAVRPTTDRIRETLFNWLAPHLPGAYCLDCFAGSGALGFEAISRGAERVLMLDNNPLVIQHLQNIAQQLASPQVHCQLTSLPKGLHAIGSAKPYRIVFLDPPFRQQLLSACCQQLEASQHLASPCYIYLEYEKELTDLVLPSNWRVIKQKQAGQVSYVLVERTDD